MRVPEAPFGLRISIFRLSTAALSLEWQLLLMNLMLLPAMSMTDSWRKGKRDQGDIMSRGDPCSALKMSEAREQSLLSLCGKLTIPCIELWEFTIYLAYKTKIKEELLVWVTQSPYFPKYVIKISMIFMPNSHNVERNARYISWRNCRKKDLFC